jgi:hypothetical protein
MKVAVWGVKNVGTRHGAFVVRAARAAFHDSVQRIAFNDIVQRLNAPWRVPTVSVK